MALDFLKDMLGTMAALRQFRGGAVPDDLETENKYLQNIKLKKDVYGVDDENKRQVEERKRQEEESKLVFTSLKELAMDNKLSPVARDHYTELLRNHYFNLSPDMRAVVEPLMRYSPLDPMEIKANEYDKIYGPSMPKMPYQSTKTGKNSWQGGPAPITPENEAEWAKYELAMGRYTYRRDIFLLGKEAADAKKQPKLIQVLDSIGEGENRRPGNLWFLDEDSQMVMRAPFDVIGEDLQKARERGYPLPVAIKNNFFPETDPITITDANGNTSRMVGGRDLITGAPKFDVHNFGKKKAKTEGIPPDMLEALGYVVRGTKWDSKEKDKITNMKALPIVRTIQEAMKQYPKEDDLIAHMGEINEKIRGSFPGMGNNKLIYREDSRDTTKWPLGLGDRVDIGDSNWSIIPVQKEPVDFIAKTTDGRSDYIRLFYDPERKVAYGADGQAVKESVGKEPGEELENVVVKPKTLAGPVMAKSPRRLGDIIAFPEKIVPIIKEKIKAFDKKFAEGNRVIWEPGKGFSKEFKKDLMDIYELDQDLGGFLNEQFPLVTWANQLGNWMAKTPGKAIKNLLEMEIGD